MKQVIFFIFIWTPASPAPNSRKLKSKSKKILSNKSWDNSKPLLPEITKNNEISSDKILELQALEGLNAKFKNNPYFRLLNCF